MFQVHILTIGTGEDRVLPHPARAAQLGGIFSPDGRMIAYLRAEPDNLLQMVVAPADGSGTGIALGPRAPFGSDGPTINNYSWSPDGTAILANYDADKKALLLPSTGLPRPSSPTVSPRFPRYQRLAP